jgi:hypothetical protein
MEDFGPRGDPSVDISKYLRNGQEKCRGGSMFYNMFSTI